MPEPAARQSDPEARAAFARRAADWPTLALLLLLWAGLLGNGWWMLRSPGPVLVHVLVSVFFLNLSFTVWHEAVHGTVFTGALGRRGANSWVGVLGAWPAMIPFFMIRRVHQLHHRHTNDPERDPDFWFLEGSIWSLPLRYPAGTARARRLYLASDPPAWEIAADRGLLALIPLSLLLAWWLGALPVLLAVWVIPKLFAMWIHAWYVNVLPHRGLPAERFRDTRVFPLAWLCPLTVFHNYHGLHHAWQTVPWHRYPAAFRARRAFLEERGMPIHEQLRAP